MKNNNFIFVSLTLVTLFNLNIFCIDYQLENLKYVRTQLKKKTAKEVCKAIKEEIGKALVTEHKKDAEKILNNIEKDDHTILHTMIATFVQAYKRNPSAHEQEFMQKFPTQLKKDFDACYKNKNNLEQDCKKPYTLLLNIDYNHAENESDGGGQEYRWAIYKEFHILAIYLSLKAIRNEIAVADIPNKLKYLSDNFPQLKNNKCRTQQKI